MKKVMLAASPEISTNYQGEFAGEYIGSAILSANTIANNGITVMPNVKYKSTLKNVETDHLVQDATCDFIDEGNVKLNDRVIQVYEKQINKQLCKTPFEQDWDAVSMGFSAFDQIPAKFSDFFIARMLKQLALETENYIWNLTDGLPFLLADDGAYVMTYGTVDASNVIAKLGEAVDNIDPAYYGREDLNLYVSQNVAKAYVRALGGFSVLATSNSGVDAKGTSWYNGGGLSFDGVNIFVANGLGANGIVASTVENLYFGTGLLDDANVVKTIDMADIDGSKNVRFIARFTRGLQVGFGAGSVVHADL